jgi:hypothetical protein
MKIDKNLLYEYLDVIIIEAEIAEADNSKNILYEKHLNPISNEEREEYFEICEKVVSLGVKLGYMRYISKEYDWFELTEKGIKAKSKGGYFKYLKFIENKELEKIKPTIIAENYIGGDNHGTQSLKNLKTEIKQIIHPKTKEKQQNAIISFIEKFWWQILIPLSLGIALLAIQQKWFT